MESKIITNNATLLGARKELLDRASFTSILPKGKYKGFDVFTWLDSPLDGLLSTLMSMPFPIQWVVSSRLLELFISEGYTEFPNVATIYVLGEMEYINIVGDYIVVHNIQDVISKEVFASSKGTLLLSLTGNNGVDFINDFTYYLKAIQRK